MAGDAPAEASPKDSAVTGPEAREVSVEVATNVDDCGEHLLQGVVRQVHVERPRFVRREWPARLPRPWPRCVARIGAQVAGSKNSRVWLQS